MRQAYASTIRRHVEGSYICATVQVTTQKDCIWMSNPLARLYVMNFQGLEVKREKLEVVKEQS